MIRFSRPATDFGVPGTPSMDRARPGQGDCYLACLCMPHCCEHTPPKFVFSIGMPQTKTPIASEYLQNESSTTDVFRGLLHLFRAAMIDSHLAVVVQAEVSRFKRDGSPTNGSPINDVPQIQWVSWFPNAQKMQLLVVRGFWDSANN